MTILLMVICHNHSFGLATTIKGLQRCRLTVKPKNHISCSREVEVIIEPSHSQVNSQIFRERLQGSKPIGLKSSLYH